MHEVRDTGLGDMGESLSRLRLCSSGALEQMERSLRRLGQLSAVLSYRRGDRLEVIDGFKRVRAARALGWTTIRTEVVKIDPAGAKLRMLRSNEGHGMSDIEEAWLVRSLYREDELTQPAIAVLFGRHKSWVSRRLLLAEGLCDEVQADLRLGLVSTTVAREVARLPRGNQREVSAVAARRGLTTRQTTSMVEQWLSSPDAEGRSRALQEAGMSGDSSGPRTPKTSSTTPGEQIVRDADAIATRSVRLQVRLMERPLSCLGTEVAELCRARLVDLGSVLAALGTTLARVTSPSDPQSTPTGTDGRQDDRA